MEAPKLQKWQKNQIFNAIQEVGLDPKEFDLEDDGVEVRIKHKWSDSSFIVDLDLAGHYVGRYVAGDGSAWPFEAYNWQNVVPRISRWLEEVSAPFLFTGLEAGPKMLWGLPSTQTTKRLVSDIVANAFLAY